MTGVNPYTSYTQTPINNKIARFCRQNNAIKIDCYLHIRCGLRLQMITMVFGLTDIEIANIVLRHNQRDLY